MKLFQLSILICGKLLEFHNVVNLSDIVGFQRSLSRSIVFTYAPTNKKLIINVNTKKRFKLYL